jgi:2-polyprenyl-6-methoxyphenol hydroxylase-like FAD-dependent oxidoreductase
MLSRDGLNVLAIDRTTFPSDTMSGHFIQPAGVSCLRRLGLLESLEALGAPAQETMTVDFGPGKSVCDCLEVY